MKKQSRGFLSSLLFGILVLGVLFSCKKNPTPPIPTDSLILGSQISINVQGRITDELGQPIEGATVKAGYSSQTIQT
ncbi:MAG: hypothetical protein EBS86_16435, partial [Crocinitomicaceae bacterium]|nr:hypothetical protein [Crocinitomicaceae bacterium]